MNFLPWYEKYTIKDDEYSTLSTAAATGDTDVMKVAMNATHGSGSNLHDKQHEAIIENRNVAADGSGSGSADTRSV